LIQQKSISFLIESNKSILKEVRYLRQQQTDSKEACVAKNLFHASETLADYADFVDNLKNVDFKKSVVSICLI
jgi:hypothetical protein